MPTSGETKAEVMNARDKLRLAELDERMSHGGIALRLSEQERTEYRELVSKALIEEMASNGSFKET